MNWYTDTLWINTTLTEQIQNKTNKTQTFSMHGSFFFKILLFQINTYHIFALSSNILIFLTSHNSPKDRWLAKERRERVKKEEQKGKESSENGQPKVSKIC